MCVAARRIMKPPKRAKKPAGAWRSSIVTSVAAGSSSAASPARSSEPAPAVAGRQAHFGLGRAQHPAERRPLQALGPAQRVLVLVAVHEVEVGPHEFALAGGEHLREGAPLDVLHAGHPRPPARQVMGVADQLPELIRGGRDRAAATCGGHRGELMTRSAPARSGRRRLPPDGRRPDRRGAGPPVLPLSCLEHSFEFGFSLLFLCRRPSTSGGRWTCCCIRRTPRSGIRRTRDHRRDSSRRRR